MTVNDIYGNPYEIKDIKSFKNHIVEFHTLNGLPDNSLHEENGFYFRKLLTIDVNKRMFLNC